MSRPRDGLRLNMTPMIDVVFQLLVFFLVSMKFKTLDMKIEADLPRTAGVRTEPSIEVPPPRIDASLRSDAAASPRLYVANQLFGRAAEDATWARFEDHVRETRARAAEAGLDPETVEGQVHADTDVATGHVVRTIDTFLAADVTKVRFRGAAPPGPDRR